MIPPIKIKKGIDKGFKICYNVFIAVMDGPQVPA